MKIRMSSMMERVAGKVTASVLEDVKGMDIPQLWYENEQGERYVPPDLAAMTGPDDVPKEYKYQVSRFPTTVTTNYLKNISQEDVDACAHDAKYMKTDHGLIDGLEGRTCEYCGGYQSKKVGESWPEKLDAYGSKSVMSMGSGCSDDLVLALVDKGMKLAEAMIAAGGCCERCMNVLADECGLDWGYAEGSEDWEKCGTSCGLCDGKGYI